MVRLTRLRLRRMTITAEEGTATDHGTARMNRRRG